MYNYLQLRTGALSRPFFWSTAFGNWTLWHTQRPLTAPACWLKLCHSEAPCSSVLWPQFYFSQRCQLVMKKIAGNFSNPKKGNLNHIEWVYWNNRIISGFPDLSGNLALLFSSKFSQPLHCCEARQADLSLYLWEQHILCSPLRQLS